MKESCSQVTLLVYLCRIDCDVYMFIKCYVPRRGEMAARILHLPG